MKQFLFWLAGSFFGIAALAQVPAPEKFLGYALGSGYTPHAKIVAYFEAVAAAQPTTIKLHRYGKTLEGRSLMVAYISSAENIANLENIRKNNLALAGLQPGSATTSTPAIVWMSYNVHGNEASSSEAAMATLYALADPSNSETKQWLKNTVVILDPCMNPDGRDRYVNWFNSVAGARYNISLDAREHHEPWPGGRTNHYNFDLNRDWAWQTQAESQQRMQLYNQWLPQVHVDFHEQGINNPYYFAPAAQPYHQVITAWQRRFQQVIGSNHAQYFDKNGWLYFTKEEFDLLYPSYGDTYPIYNGSIGMTYEQGGGPAGGVAVLTQDGDTLTLAQRVQHHFTTSLSTVEVASKNATSLLAEFKKFFDEASAGNAGEYKAYIVKANPNDRQKIEALQQLLAKNLIQFGTAKEGNYKGFNYSTGKDASFSIGANDVVIPGNQPKGVLVRVLFEPQTQIVDSNTYDITAWSLPYAYGLNAFAVKQPIALTGTATTAWRANEIDKDPYGYVIPWSGVKSGKAVAQLLQKGVKLRMSQTPFEINGQRFDRGAVIVLKTSNQYRANLWNEVRNTANQYQVTLTPVNSGLVEKGYDFGSSKVVPLKARRVALLTGDGISANAAGEVWHFFDKEIEYPVTLVNLSDFYRIRWNDYDVIIMPNGNYRFLNDKAQAAAFEAWIRNGGSVIALENAVAQLSKLEGGIKPKASSDPADADVYAPLKKYEERERDFIPNLNPGSIFRVELDNSHPLAFGYPNYYYTLKQDGAIYEFMDDGWNVGVIKKEKQVAGFVGTKLKNRLQDGLLFGVQQIGGGSVTYLTDDILFRNFWENGKLMFANAVFFVGQ